MIVAVRAMRMVEMPTHDIINVVPMRCGFMPTFRAVYMFTIVPFAFVVGRAAGWIGATYRNRVLIDMLVMDVMQVTIMEIVRMPFVAYSHVPTIRVVDVTVF